MENSYEDFKPNFSITLAKEMMLHERAEIDHNPSETDVEMFQSPGNATEALPELFHPSSYERGFITSANVGILLCSIGILLNGSLFVILCKSRRLRLHYLYIQIMSIALADLSFIVMVDSFTIYFEMQPWNLGAAFCKAWMILDVALPGVSLVALLLLNIDRVLFTHKNRLYYSLLRRPVSRIAVILSPWVLSASVVCSLWLGFPEVQPEEGLCMYGITEEANSASSWLMVFLPSLLIFVLIIFVFIAFIGEMPPVTSMATERMMRNDMRQPHLEAGNGDYSLSRRNTNLLTHSSNSEVFAKDSGVGTSDGGEGSSAEVMLMTDYNQPYPILQSLAITAKTGDMLTRSGQARTHRRFIAALLAVDFFSLAITLPYSAFSLVNPVCTDAESCASLRSLFQTLSWMRSSSACVRPLLFILLTDIWSSTKQSLSSCYRPAEQTVNCSDSNNMLPRVVQEPDAQLQIRGHQANTYNSCCQVRIISNAEPTEEISPMGVKKESEMVSDDEPDNNCTLLDHDDGYNNKDTSMTMRICIKNSPPISPISLRKQTRRHSLKTKGCFSRIKFNRRSKSFDYWVQEDSAATYV
ncbi:beta-2 adrenergic receptor [Plakobranchus ocellatus]|uniref:Beta-2 adrenergic receptor n=1 Tax=Plakobranchus ocellatus TaxID=259542 RepID=A0AAV4AHG5_9GAST|nr:beta-2 adrenergic receptor [Plakobranchus ocellatus]